MAARVPSLRIYQDRAKRTHTVSSQLLIYYGRLLGWLSHRDILPGIGTRSLSVPRHSPPRHVICESPCGRKRCVRCLRVADACSSSTCMGVHDRPHVMLLVQDGLFCQRCGAYTFSLTVRLHSACRGRPSGPSARRRLDALLQGKHPVTGVFLGLPQMLGEPAGPLVLDIGPGLADAEQSEHEEGPV